MLINSAILTSERPIELKAVTPKNKVAGHFSDRSEYQVKVNKYYSYREQEYKYNYNDVKDKLA